MTAVEGELGEHLSLVLPLSLDQKPAVEWLAGLERAVSFSLASRLTDCLATLPHTLAGRGGFAKKQTVVMPTNDIWAQNRAMQAMQ